ncbi:MAG: hypothetical protein F6K35_21800 [Okeania sp. SIO2H7]|nr:hypothetical protein [Okeania sp. SIO2H7]
MDILRILLSDEIKAPATRLKELIKPCVHELSQAESIWHNKRKIAALSLENILEKMGELSGLSVKIYKLSDRFQEIIRNEVDCSWDLWLTTLQEDLKQKWSGQIENEQSQTKEELVKSYSKKLNQELTEKFKNWLHEVINEHLKPVNLALNTISSNLRVLSEDVSVESRSQILAEIDGINANSTIQEYWQEKSTEANKSQFGIINFASDVLGNVGSVFAPVAGITKVLPFPNKQEQQKQSIKEVVFEIGWESFVSSKSQLMNQIEEFAVLIVDAKIKPTKKVIDQTISLYCEILDLQALYQQETPEKQQSEKTWIVETRQQLEHIQNQLEVMLNEATSS